MKQLRRKMRKKIWKNALPALLAAMMWIEGTLGNVYAVEADSQSLPVVSDIQNKEDADTESAAEEALAPEDQETMKEGNAALGDQETMEERNAAPGDQETMEEGNAAPGDQETAGEGNAALEDQEMAEEGNVPPDDQETVEEERAAETVSENAAEPEKDPLESQDFGEECALGEAPVSAEAVNGRGNASFNQLYSAARSGSISRQTPSVSQIIDRYQASPWSLSVANSYSENPSTKSPYRAGHLSDGSLENVLNLLNFIRYVAGIPADVTLDEEYAQKAQAGTLLNCVNGILTHDPAWPDGFPNDLYQAGKSGCSSSNIASGYGNLAKSLLNGWMYDGDSSNIDQMGHRRWILNPAMEKTGFGAVGAYSAMYVFDAGGSTVTDFVAWPAQNMPIELMNGSGTPWTVSLGSDYRAADMQKVSVTLRDVSDRKTWTFSGTNANGLFKVNTDYYGMPNCIIFRPNSVSYNKDSRFQVTINGLTNQEGKGVSLSYHVDFFSLNDRPTEVTEVTLNKTNVHLVLGDEEEKGRASLLPAVKPGNASDKTLTWKSGNEAVARVDAQGNVEAVGVGVTEISATAANGVQAVCIVKVSAYSLSGNDLSFDEESNMGCLSFDLTTDKAAKKLEVMDSQEPAADKIKWISENENVATVSDGTVTPVGVGETVVWADVEDGLQLLMCGVKVENFCLPTLKLREDNVTLNIRRNAEGSLVGDTTKLKAYLTPADGKWKKIRWESDNMAVAALVTDGTETAAKMLGDTTVFAKAAGEGAAKITAVLVDENGADVVIDGKRAEASCTVTVRKEAELKRDEIPVAVALTNIHVTLHDVALPTGWSWKYPDTVLTQFAGQKSKKFAAVYLPEGADNRTMSVETLLEVCFLHVESISVELRTENGEMHTGSTLTAGQKYKCYVNYSFEDILDQYESNAYYKDNAYFQEQKEKLLRELGDSITWSSSKDGVISVESTGNGAGMTAQGVGSVTVKGSLELGKKSFSDSLKITVTEPAGALVVKDVDKFRPVGTDGVYVSELSLFLQEMANQVNSKITLTLQGADKVTAKSNNAAVVAVKSQAAEGNGFAVSLIVKAAGTAQITLTGNDAAKTSRIITLIVTDAEPGLSDESITVNTIRNTDTVFYIYPAQAPTAEGWKNYEVTKAAMAADEKSANFYLTWAKEEPEVCKIRAKSGTKAGTYKTKIQVTVSVSESDERCYELPLTVKVVSKQPTFKVRQVNKLNLFYKDTKSQLQIDTDGQVENVVLTGCADYAVEEKDGAYYVKAKNGAALNSVRKGSLRISFADYPGTYTVDFTVGVEKKVPKFSLETDRVTFYPKAGINSVRVGFKNTAAALVNSLEKVELVTGAKGNYTVKPDNVKSPGDVARGLILSGENMNQAESFKATIRLQDKTWTEAITLSCDIKVSYDEPSIALSTKTMQLNANAAYKGYDAATTTVRWKDGGDIMPDTKARVSVYCDAKDAKAKTLVLSSQVVFSVMREKAAVKVAARLNNKDVNAGSYKFIVQVSQDGRIWKTPLTLKVVNTAPDRAVKISVKGSIDVLNREGSFITLTPSLMAVNGEFVIPKNVTDPQDPEYRKVELTGRDGHLFTARWDETGTKIELRAKENSDGNEISLVTKYQYTVTPVLILKNASGEIEQFEAPAVSFKVKQSSVKVTVSPKAARMYSGAYNSVTVNVKTAIKGAEAPEIESVTLADNTNAFCIAAYDGKTGDVTLAMMKTGQAAKGKSYTLKLQVRLTDQADNGKPATVRFTVKVK